MISIAAMSLNRVIGKNGEIPWCIKGDLRFFKKFTMGKRILVGRKTYESLPALNGREIWILSSRNVNETEWPHKVVHNISDIPDDIIVAGGAKVYFELLPQCSDLYLTIIKKEYEGDTFMPEFEHLFHAYEVIESDEEYEIRHYKVV